MVRVVKVLAYCFFFILALMYFSPKESIYYFLEQELKSYSIVISKEAVRDNGFNLVVLNSTVSIKAVDEAKISGCAVKIYGLYNSLYFEDITLYSTAKPYMPAHIDMIKLKYSILDPLNIVVAGNGDFGEANGNINFLEKVLHLNLKPSTIMLKKYEHVLKTLKKSENGEYVYEKNI